MGLPFLLTPPGTTRKCSECEAEFVWIVSATQWLFRRSQVRDASPDSTAAECYELKRTLGICLRSLSALTLYSAKKKIKLCIYFAILLYLTAYFSSVEPSSKVYLFHHFTTSRKWNCPGGTSCVKSI